MWSDRGRPCAVAAGREAVRSVRLPRSTGIRRTPIAGPAESERWVRLLRGGARHLTWLDGGHDTRHLIAWDPLLRFRVAAGRAWVRGGGSEQALDVGGFEMLEALETELSDGSLRLFGFLGYELAAELESLPPLRPADVELPDCWLALHDAWIEVDRDRGVLVTASDRWDDSRRAALAGMLGAGPADPGRSERSEPEPIPNAARVRADTLSLETERVTVQPDDDQYERAVERVSAAIHRGELFQTNLCRRFEVMAPPSSATLYRRMRRAGDCAHGAWIEAPGWQVMSRSPELFLRVRGDRVESRPIKGTRPRGRAPEEDALLREALLGSPKDGAELAMIVDLVRNDLGRVCAPGSVEVREHRRLMELAGVWHTFSRVVGRLRSGIGPVDLLRAAFPPGSVTGAPKIQAMVVAAAEEPARRGVAMGAIGWIEPSGDLELSVAIRTAVADRERVVYHAGCGIVADSDPREEREESLVKARAFLGAFAS